MRHAAQKHEEEIRMMELAQGNDVTFVKPQVSASGCLPCQDACAHSTTALFILSCPRCWVVGPASTARLRCQDHSAEIRWQGIPEHLPGRYYL